MVEPPTDDPEAVALHARFAPLLPLPTGRPLVFAHLAQSLDGRIALDCGCSQWLTGPEDLDHTHRLRAMADAVLVGASTASVDDPRLTVRRVPGPHPLRVVLDPRRRLTTQSQILREDVAPTLLLCTEELAGAPVGCAEVVGLPTTNGWIAPETILAELHARGVRRLLIEGGGVTVSHFLQANLLDRLHLVTAPLLLGSGRPGIRLSAITSLSGARRPAVRVERLGVDTLFDCDFSEEDLSFDEAAQ